MSACSGYFRALIVLIHLLPAWPSPRSRGCAQRTFVRRWRSSMRRRLPRDYRESAALLESLLADGYPQRRGVLQPGQRVLPGGRVRPRHRGVPQGQAVPPPRPLSRGELASGALGGPGPACPNRPPRGGGTSCSGAAGCRSPRRPTAAFAALSAGGPGGLRGLAPPPAGRLRDRRGLAGRRAPS